MHISTNTRILIVAFSLLLLFGGVYILAGMQPQGVSGARSKDIRAAALAMKKVRKKIKSAISSPEDPQARYMYEYRRLRNPYTGKIPENIRQKELAFSATLPVAEARTFAGTSRNARGQAEDWQRRGPYNVGGRTRALAIDVANENIILAGGVSGGMWRSINGGNAWTKTTDPNLLQSVTTVDQDKRTGKTNTWYYGTGELVGNSASAVGALYRGNGIYKSTDNGASWQVLPRTVTSDLTTFNNVFQWVWRVATNPGSVNQDQVFAATLGGIQRSTDGGATWSNALGSINGTTATSQARFTDIDISPSGVMYATLSSVNSLNSDPAPVKGIFRSTDGITWTDITPPNWPTTYERVVLDISPNNENIVYFLANTPGAGKRSDQDIWTSLWKYTYVSGNGTGTGGTWENRSGNIPAFGGQVGNYDHQGNYNMVIKVKPDNSNHVIIGGTNLYQSTTGFATSRNTKWIGGYTLENNAGMYPNHHPDQHELAFYPSNTSRLLSAHDGGLSRTDNVLASDTVRWTSLNRGYLTTQFTSVAIDLDETDNLILGGMQDNGTFFNNGRANENAAWESLLSGDGAYGAAVANSLIVSAQNGFIYRYAFENNGDFQGYARIDPLDQDSEDYLFVNPYVIDPNNQYVMYLPAGVSLWRNNNLNAIPVGEGDQFSEQTNRNWQIISTLSPSAANEVISAVAVSKSPANVVYYGTSTGKLYKLTDALTVDRPTSTAITGTNFPANAYITSIAVDPADANNVIVAFSNYGVISLFRTTTGGTGTNAWTAVAGNLEENLDGSGNGPAVKWVNILPSSSGGETKYFVGTTTGLYATDTFDGTSTIWIKEGTTTIGDVPVDMVVSRSTDNLVVVGTHGNGVYSYNYNEPIPDVELPEEGFTLKNYPNPFGEADFTTIEYNLSKSGHVTIRIFDAIGKQIETLLNTDQSAGVHRVRWNGRSSTGGPLPNGMYLYSVQVDDKQLTKRMLLLRK